MAELEAMEEDELNRLFGLTPKFDIPAAARRSVERVGILAQDEGGMRSGDLAGQPGALVRAALEGTRGPLVSRWGHILLRRTLSSRLDAPQGLDPVDFAAMRAVVLNRMGEGQAARMLVQDVDTANYNAALTNAAFDAYLAAGDLLGMCPVVQLQGAARDDADWRLTRSVCDAYAGQARSAERDLARALGRGEAPAIDVLLAQRFAGAAAEGSRAVNIEWNGVDEITPWRFSLARTLGVELPQSLLAQASPRYAVFDALIPAVPLLQRTEVAAVAGGRGVLSAAAMVDLFSQLWASEDVSAAQKQRAQYLRDAYVAPEITARLAAMRRLWDAELPSGYAGASGADYGQLVLTAYAAARLPVNEALLDDAEPIIASMLAAGLDRNAMRWGSLVNEGSAAWGLLVVAQPARSQPVSGRAFGRYVGNDQSEANRKSQFLLAGLAGLGRLEDNDVSQYASDLGVDLARQSAWSTRIERAGEYGNPALVALLAGVGMQGDGWNRMTARHLYHIVRALDRAGLNAEARMIAAEAVARA